METVRQLLKNKGNDLWTTAPDTSVIDALKIMAERRVGALLVLEAGKLAGIFSERDYARKAIDVDGCTDSARVEDIMSKKVLYVEPQNTVDECMALMTEKRLRHLPVCEAGDLVGIVTIGDVVKAKISDQEFLVDQLVHYITRGPMT